MYSVISFFIEALKRVIPKQLFNYVRKPYHFLISFVMALVYGFPAREMVVIGVTGTKGKSSVCDMLYEVLARNGYKVALASTIRFAIKEHSRPNLFKMTTPGRGYVQKFMREARKAGCTHVVLEVTSESTKDFRHLFLFLNALIFTNLYREHIESHGSFEKYALAKQKIGHELAQSFKRPRAMISNADNEHSAPYRALSVEKQISFSYEEAKHVSLSLNHASFVYDETPVSLSLPGAFSIMNALAVFKTAEFLGIKKEGIAKALSSIEKIAGRTERIDEGQAFNAVVDYAHTPDSLQAIYDAYPGRKICVLGNTGGGRDTWKRPEMGKIADRECAEVILTNEDPYDEDPQEIVNQMAKGMERAPKIIMDRREAIKTALSLAKENDSVLITGKGTDPYIMEANGKKTPWSDAQVVREELRALLENK